MDVRSAIRSTPLRTRARRILALSLSPLLAAGLAAQETNAAKDEPAPERVLQLTLEDAVRIALNQNLDLESEALNTEILQFDALGSWGLFDPTLSSSFSWTNAKKESTNQFAGDGEDDDLFFNVGLDVPLQTGGAITADWDHFNRETDNQVFKSTVFTTDSLKLAITQPLLKGAWSRYATSVQREQEIAHSRAEEQAKQVRQRVIRDVMRGYWNLVSSIEEVRVRELALERAQTQLKQDERRLELGVATQVEVLQSETSLAQQEERLLNAEFLRTSAEDTLRQTFQRPGEENLDEWDWPIEPLTTLPAVEEGLRVDWRQSYAKARETRPELWQRRLDIEAAELRLVRARSERKPQLDLTLSTQSDGFDGDPNDSRQEVLDRDFPTNSASLNFSIPIFNRNARYAVRAYRSEVRRARVQFDQSDLVILGEVRAAVRDLVYRAEALLAAQKSASLAERQLEAEQVRMDVGMSTTFQVLEFQETLAEARSAEVAASAAYANALVSLRHAEGALGGGRSSGEDDGR